MILRRRHLRRLREIGAILVRHGWGHAFARLGLADLLRMKPTGVKGPGTPERLVLAIEELGPTFVKLGQLLSTRPDLLPAEYITELSRLQDTAPTIPPDQIRAIIEEELGCPINEVYRSFSDEPLAAASLGQVHEATMLDGQEVIIKVQRPGIANVIERDIEILYHLTKFLENRFERAKTYGLTDVVDEFAITIREELDYVHEARNTERLKENLTQDKHVKVPTVYWDLVTRRVLTMERIDGVKITDLKKIDDLGIDRKKVASWLTAAFFKQIFVDGYFHADPHPGNLLVTPDQCIALLDVGQVRQLDIGSRSALVRLMIAYENHDTREFAEEIASVGIARGEIDMAELTYDLEKVLRHYYGLPSRAVNMGQLLMRVMDVSARHRIRLPIGFAVVGKALANIDGVDRQLDPDINFTEMLKPFMSLAVREQLSLEKLVVESYRAAMDLKGFIFGLPEHLNQILRKAVEGSLRIEFKHKGLEELESRLDRSTNRLSFALIVGSIIIGSSIIVVSKPGAKSLPALGIAGYVIATLMGMWLLFSIIRSGRL